jgi:rhodanese-related sulfurtransferase
MSKEAMAFMQHAPFAEEVGPPLRLRPIPALRPFPLESASGMTEVPRNKEDCPMDFPPRIALAEARELLFRQLPVVFVDARKARDFRSSDLQLPGALRIPPDDVEAHIDEVPGGDVTIVVYCACPREASSALVAQKLIEHGIKQVFPLSGGFRRWLESDAPMERQGERQPTRVESQPNLVREKDIATESMLGSGPRGHTPGRD